SAGAAASFSTCVARAPDPIGASTTMAVAAGVGCTIVIWSARAPTPACSSACVTPTAAYFAGSCCTNGRNGSDSENVPATFARHAANASSFSKSLVAMSARPKYPDTALPKSSTPAAEPAGGRPTVMLPQACTPPVSSVHRRPTLSPRHFHPIVPPGHAGARTAARSFTIAITSGDDASADSAVMTGSDSRPLAMSGHGSNVSHPSMTSCPFASASAVTDASSTRVCSSGWLDASASHAARSSVTHTTVSGPDALLPRAVTDVEDASRCDRITTATTIIPTDATTASSRFTVQAERVSSSSRVGWAGFAPHRPHRGAALDVDLLGDLEAVPPVERNVPLLRRLEVARDAFLVALGEHRRQQRRADALALVVGVRAEHGEVPVRLARVDLLHPPEDPERPRRLQAEPEQQPHLPEQLGAAGAPLVGCEPGRGTEAVVATGGVQLALGLPQRTVELRVEERRQLAPPAVVAAEQERHHGVVVEGTHECLRDAGDVRLAGRPHLGHRPKLVPVGLTAVSETAPIPVAELGRRAKAASRVLATCGTAAKDAALLAAADLLVARADEILEGNRADVERAEADGVTATVIDRLRLTGARIEAMAAGLRKVAALADPVGEVVGGW